VKREEQRLFEECRDREIRGEDFFQRSTMDIAEELGIPLERAEAYARKWADRGWYRFGQRPLFGELTAAGLSQ